MDTKRKFRCTRCGRCCQWKGYVRIDPRETEAIAAHVKTDILAFTEKFTVLTSDRTSLSLSEKADGSCIFFDAGTKRCDIYPVRPRQCVEFPSGWNFHGWKNICGGVNKPD
jgi:Fe-S-cluster containining protein